jgi:hypothetical protein
MNILLRSLLFLSFQLLTVLLSAQEQREEAGTREYRPANQRSISGESWNKAAGSLDYSRDRPEENPPDEIDLPQLEPPAPADFSWFGTLIQIIAVTLVLAGIGWWFYRIMNMPANRRIAKEETHITPGNLELYIHETDLDKRLSDALAQEQYNLAIRIHYLQIIRALSGKKYIRWSKEKTNREYLRELKGTKLEEPVRNITSVYERIWYGNRQTDQEDYLLLASDFIHVLRQV